MTSPAREGYNPPNIIVQDQLHQGPDHLPFTGFDIGFVIVAAVILGCLGLWVRGLSEQC